MTQPALPATTDNDPKTPRKGRQIPKSLGGYRLIDKLGKGGSNTVFTAIQISMDRTVALKVLPPKQAQSDVVRGRFVSEAHLAGRVHHTNVITCFDMGEDQGWLYMALELAEGGSLGDLLKHYGGVLPERLALGLARDCGRGVAALARAGIVHRDIKPANIFVTGDMIPKIADLGMAVPSAAALQRRDWEFGDDLIVGTPNYMAPEQARAERPITLQADIFALGATLFRMLCGRPPFMAGDPQETLQQAKRGLVPDPRDFAPNLSTKAAEVIRLATAPDPRQRFTSAADMVGMIEEALQGSLGRETAPDLSQALAAEQHHQERARTWRSITRPPDSETAADIANLDLNAF